MNNSTRRQINLDADLLADIEQIALSHFDARIHNGSEKPVITKAINHLLRLGIKSFEADLESKLDPNLDLDSDPLEDLSDLIMAINDLEYLSSQDLKNLIYYIIELNRAVHRFYLDSIEFQDEDLADMVADQLRSKKIHGEDTRDSKSSEDLPKEDTKIAPKSNGGNGVVKAKNLQERSLSDSELSHISAIPNSILERIRLGKIDPRCLSPKSQKILSQYSLSEDRKSWFLSNK